MKSWKSALALLLFASVTATAVPAYAFEGETDMPSYGLPTGAQLLAGAYIWQDTPQARYVHAPFNGHDAWIAYDKISGNFLADVDGYQISTTLPNQEWFNNQAMYGAAPSNFQSADISLIDELNDYRYGDGVQLNYITDAANGNKYDMMLIDNNWTLGYFVTDKQWPLVSGQYDTYRTKVLNLRSYEDKVFWAMIASVAAGASTLGTMAGQAIEAKPGVSTVLMLAAAGYTISAVKDVGAGFTDIYMARKDIDYLFNQIRITGQNNGFAWNYRSDYY